MPAPLVSICLPNFNSMPFTRARLESLLSQTWQHWECLVMDSGSGDGSLELIQAYADNDERIQIHHIPKEGCYPAFNAGIERCKGEYIYIATADDTLDSEGLAYMVNGLEQHPECGACHTPLRIVNPDGQEIPNVYETYEATQYFRDWQHQAHIRRRGHDAWLATLLPCVYPSVTQMLYRRNAVLSAGPFPCEYGPNGDFAWHLRLAAFTDTLHLPKAVATWRMHPSQLTRPLDPLDLAEIRLKMVLENLDFLKASLPKPKRGGWSSVGFLYRLERFRLRIASQPAYIRRIIGIVSALTRDPQVLRQLHWGGGFNRSLSYAFKPGKVSKRWMQQQGYDQLLETQTDPNEDLSRGDNHD